MLRKLHISKSIWILPKFIIILTLETFFLLKVIKHRFDYQKQTNKNDVSIALYGNLNFVFSLILAFLHYLGLMED
ncbi:hypothetical protein Avbf_15168 [Armadillidium vulgare]|nr:hypothetical protein Avbf_15168 [Armadillidium vulgare]